jgi:hypothetical protein
MQPSGLSVARNQRPHSLQAPATFCAGNWCRARARYANCSQPASWSVAAPLRGWHLDHPDYCHLMPFDRRRKSRPNAAEPSFDRRACMVDPGRRLRSETLPCPGREPRRRDQSNRRDGTDSANWRNARDPGMGTGSDVAASLIEPLIQICLPVLDRTTSTGTRSVGVFQPL